MVKPLQSGLKPSSWMAHDGLLLSLDWSSVHGLIVSGGEGRKYKVHPGSTKCMQGVQGTHREYKVHTGSTECIQGVQSAYREYRVHTGSKSYTLGVLSAHREYKVHTGSIRYTQGVQRAHSKVCSLQLFPWHVPLLHALCQQALGKLTNSELSPMSTLPL